MRRATLPLATFFSNANAETWAKNERDGRGGMPVSAIYMYHFRIPRKDTFGRAGCKHVLRKLLIQMEFFMPDKTLKSLRAARDDNDLESFVSAHECDAPGDLDKLNAMIGCSSENGEPKAASRRGGPSRESE